MKTADNYHGGQTHVSSLTNCLSSFPSVISNKAYEKRELMHENNFY